MNKNPIALNPIWLSGDFFQRVTQISQQFQQDNVRSVGLWLEDAAQFACVLLACFRADVKVLLPPNLLDENQIWLQQNADILFDDIRFQSYGHLQKVVDFLPLVDWQCQTEVWLKTSGSSGEAKILKKTASLLWQEAIEVGKFLPFQQSGTHTIGSVSIQHFYGLTYRVLIPLWHCLEGRAWTIGREQLVYPEYLLAESKQSSQCLWITSPALLSRLNLALPHLAEQHVVGVISSGGALDEQLAEQVQTAMRCPVLEGYGSTETGCIAFRQPYQHWKPLQDVHLGTNEQQALWVESRRTQGREQTADAVEFFGDGFELLGRLDRIVKLGDKRVSLVKIEQDLLKHSWVADAYVAQHPEKQRAVAWLALSDEGIDCLRENGRKYLTDHLKQALAMTQEKFALPRYWRLTDKLPRNAQSKILRQDFESVCHNNICDPIWLHTIEQDNSLELIGKVPLDLHYFKGHFANFPLVPGVIELQWVIEQLPRLLQREIEIERVDNLKFQQFLRPHDDLHLTLNWDVVKQRVKFQLKGNGEICASGLIIEKKCGA
ncbi:AMP-binding protein [Actinobacillus genomosp. 1]|uniref:AMP-binding protein n=1 Tax=Actinobacillus genomosp. 1 TaxID=254839 RepID=UPI0024430383|nr:AMP-binding protein [Actinobacillus genomosp. 1]WGE91022.1 AMP-binding protein [Actinobacillus genomosp. 1]